LLQLILLELGRFLLSLSLSLDLVELFLRQIKLILERGGYILNRLALPDALHSQITLLELFLKHNIGLLLVL